MASVRFICGTQTSQSWSKSWQAFLGMEDAILYSPVSTLTAACLTLLGAEISPLSLDAPNHASIIDGVFVCEAKRYRANDMVELEARLKERVRPARVMS